MVFDVLARAPDRSDVALPYLAWLLRERRWPALGSTVATLLDRNPEDPVGLFYAGTALTTLNDPAARAAGIGLIHSALDHGVERILPIEPWLRRMSASRPPAPASAFARFWPRERR